MKIQILVDNPSSWILPYVDELKEILLRKGHEVFLLTFSSDITKGDILFLLSCERIYKSLELNRHNIVIHESALPKGKGWSPLSWQILEGKNSIPITLFEASKEIDSGDIYFQDIITLRGDELWGEIKDKQGKATIALILRFIDNYHCLLPKKQEGESTFYPKRAPKDSQLNIDKTIREQFNLFRICDNDRYPAYFELNGIIYCLKISRMDK